MRREPLELVRLRELVKLRGFVLPRGHANSISGSFPSCILRSISSSIRSDCANDTTGAITAYEKFVKLAPADPLTKKVEEEIKRLKESQLPLQTG